MLIEAIEIGIYGYLTTSLFLNHGIYQRVLWLLIGLAIAGRQMSLRAAPTAPRASPVLTTA